MTNHPADSTLMTADNPTIIFNEGEPLKDCPTSYHQAYAWAHLANADKEDDVPRWKWDCGFKLDFDGSLLRVSSRFYPPKTHYGETWNGKVSLMLGGVTIEERRFDCETLEDLRVQVEQYECELIARCRSVLLPREVQP